MVIEGTHYNPNCTCKSCRRITRHTNPMNSQINWEDDFREEFQFNRKEGDTPEEKFYGMMLTEQLIDFIRKQKEASRKSGYREGVEAVIKEMPDELAVWSVRREVTGAEYFKLAEMKQQLKSKLINPPVKQEGN